MLNKNAKLSDKVFTKDIPKAPTRDGFGRGTVEAGKKNPNVVVLCADLSESTRAEWFQKEFPERFIEVGVAEQNLATVGSGMANEGKIPFIASYAAFSPGRNYEQIRTTIALNNVPVKICGMHAGVQTGPDGATHQMLEDVSLMRALPNMVVIVPGDAEEARKAVAAAAETGRPVYLRFGRASEPVFTTAETPYEIGKAYELWRSEKPQVALIGCGAVLYNALKAAQELDKRGVGSVVLNAHTVKPLDEEKVAALAQECGAIVTVEEHQVNGGLGGAVAETLAREYPTPIEFIGMHDEFGQSGEADELMEHYRMGASHIVEAALKAVERK
jgi:transketolase